MARMVANTMKTKDKKDGGGWGGNVGGGIRVAAMLPFSALEWRDCYCVALCPRPPVLVGKRQIKPPDLAEQGGLVNAELAGGG